MHSLCASQVNEIIEKHRLRIKRVRCTKLEKVGKKSILLEEQMFQSQQMSTFLCLTELTSSNSRVSCSVQSLVVQAPFPGCEPKPNDRKVAQCTSGKKKKKYDELSFGIKTSMVFQCLYMCV